MFDPCAAHPSPLRMASEILLSEPHKLMMMTIMKVLRVDTY